MARRNAQRDPLAQSRLVFACPDETLVRRARQFFAEPKESGGSAKLLLAPPEGILEQSSFKVPEPAPPKAKLKHISVTRFKTYLACPYRYYLRHVEKLQVVDDSARELDGRAFGNLIHGVLSDFGRQPKARGNPRASRNYSSTSIEHLSTLAKRHYGAKERRTQIRLQLEQARQRLHAFAARQARLTAEGWRIVHAEHADDRALLSVPFSAGGEAIELQGRIDRVDYHAQTGTLRILDYKTADKGERPDKTHRKGNEWIDLQLPMYRHLWPALKLETAAVRKVELGYFNLPKDLDETDVALGDDWDDIILQDADATAVDVICRTASGRFRTRRLSRPRIQRRFRCHLPGQCAGRPATE